MTSGTTKQDGYDDARLSRLVERLRREHATHSPLMACTNSLMAFRRWRSRPPAALVAGFLTALTNRPEPFSS